MKHLTVLCLKILFAVELADCLKIDPRLERIDRFLEQAYKMRNLRGLESPMQENFDPTNNADNIKINEVDSSKYDKKWTQMLESNHGVQSNYELDAEMDSKEEVYIESAEKFDKPAVKVKPRPKIKSVITKIDDDQEENDDVKQSEIVPIPHPIPIVVPKFIPVPVIIQHSFPFPVFPMSLANIQVDGLMKTHTSDSRTNYEHQTRRLMTNLQRRPTVGF